MQVVNHKVYLYKPDGTTFLGELIVDSLRTDIKLQDISTITFRIPEVINGQVNPRIDEVLDSYIIELWYGKVDGVYANGDFEKIRFRIYTTPLEFTDYQYLHSYAGYSLQSDLEFKQIVSWPGIQVKDFFRTITYSNSAVVSKFSEPDFNYFISESTNTSQTKYITINTTDEPSALDIFIYEQRFNSGNNSQSEVSLIELTSGGVNSNDFKAGYYYLNKTGNIVDSVSIALPDNYTAFNGSSTATLSYKFYDNPVARAFAVGITTNTETPLSNMYIDLAQDAATGDDTPEYGGYTFTSQSIYSKNGLKLNDILTGGDNEEDGILYNTGFTVGTISNTIDAKYRSNIDFNNITVHQGIKDVAESFEAIPVFDTINKTVSFYAENEYGVNKGLTIKYATYLKSINKEIDSSKIITKARSLGKDNITINLVNPTGTESWEDYSYFLDDYYISDTTGFTISADETTGLDITFPNTSGYQSRWMDAAEALKIAKWQYTRDYFHTVFSDANATVVDSSHNQYKGLYDIRSEAINLYVKYETQYEKKKADEYKYFYLVEHYRDMFENKGTNLTEYEYYQDKYNTAVAQTAAFKSTVLDEAFENIYDETSVGSLAYKFAQVRSFLDKDTWEINATKLRTFQRETTHNDSKIDTEQDLLDATKIFIDENKEPRVTFNMSIIDVLEAQEAYQDWDKFVIGDKIYIFFPEFNIDLEAQIREISIDFQGKSLSLVISTVRNYNRSFGSYLTKNIRRFHNANMNTVLYYKDGTDASITETENVRTTLNNGIDAGNTSVNTGAKDPITGEFSTTTDGEGQKSRVVTGVDLLTESLLLSAFNKGIKVSDGRILTFRPFDVDNVEWVQEVEVSAENGFVIRRVYGNNEIEKLAYISADDGSAYFAGWRLEPGQFSAGTEGSFVGINSEEPTTGNSEYAFWAGDETASEAPFSVTKSGDIKATSGNLSGLTIGTGTYIDNSGEEPVSVSKNAIFTGTGIWGADETPFYLDEDGRFSLSDELTWNPETNTFFVNGTIEANVGEIGGWTVGETQLTGGDTSLDSAGIITLGTEDEVVVLSSADSNYRLWAGNSSAAEAPFSVDKDGNLIATAATITGAITATSGSFTGSITADSGSIGGWTIGADTLTAGNITLDSTTDQEKISIGTNIELNTDGSAKLGAITISSDGSISSEDNSFTIGSDGSATFAGELSAATGSFGAVTIDNAGSLTLANITIDNSGINATVTEGDPAAQVVKFNLDSTTGLLTAVDANITGAITATSGSFTGSITSENGTIGGWTIGEDSLTSGDITLSSAEDAAQISIGENIVLNNDGSATIGVLEIGIDGSVSTETFEIDDEGNATFSGALQAATGSFGAVTIDNTGSLTLGNIIIDNSGINATVTEGDPAVEVVKFNLDSTTGLLTAVDADITGAITATSGTFTGAIEVGTNETNKISIVGASTAVGTKIYSGVGAYNNSNTGFYLDAAGKFSLGDQLYWDGAGDLQILGNLVADTGTIGGFTITEDTIQQGADTTKLALQSNGTNPFLTIGQATNGYNQTGIFLGLDSGTPKISLKSATNSLLFDGTNLSITGAITSSSGTIGGWTIGANSLSGGNATLASSGNLTLGTSDDVVRLSADDATYRLWAGNATAGSAPFTVDKDGNLVATAATITGAITATSGSFTGAITSTSGKIGGWTIGENTLTGGNIILNSTTDQEKISIGTNIELNTDGSAVLGSIEIGSDGSISSTDGSFVIDEDGAAAFAGTLTAASGSFGAVTIDAAGSITIGNITIDNTDGVVAKDEEDNIKFSLNPTTGLLTATDADITGSITAEEGTIAGWEIEETTLSKNNITLDSTGTIIVGDSAGDDVAVMSAIDSTYRLWVGDSTAADAPFKVDKDGNIDSVAGSIGNWSISSTNLKKVFSTNPEDGSETDPVNIYAGQMPSAISALGAGSYGFAIENTNPSAGEPFLAAMTSKGFFIYTDSGSTPVTAMEISYDEDYIWARGLLISDTKDVTTANVAIGTLSEDNWGLQVNNGTLINGSSITIDKDGIEIIKTVSEDSTTTFSVDTSGNVFVKGDLTASTGTFGTVATNKGNVLLGGSDPLIVRNNTTEIMKLTNAGVLTVAGFTASSSAFFSGTKSTLASNDAGVYIATDGIALGTNSPFKVTSAGVLTATSATIGGWTVDSNSIFTGTKTATENYASTAGHITIGSDGHISSKEFRIDADGSAHFAGTLEAGVIDDIADTLNLENLISELQGQIDGAIDTWFYNYVPTLSNEPASTWTTNEVKDQHRGDIFYNNSTGLAYRFSFNDPVYEWVLIDDSAVTAALSTAQSKVTIFSVSSDANYGANVDDKIQNGDYIIPLVTTTLTAAGRTSLATNYAVTKNDLYLYDSTAKTFTKSQNVENKDTGSVAGWEINSTDIKAKNNTMSLHSDSDNNGVAPYISIAQSSIGYENEGIFLGRVLHSTSPDVYYPKLSLVNSGATNYLKWTGLELQVKGNVDATSGTIGGFTIANDRIKAGTLTGVNVGIGPNMATGVSFYAGAAITSPATEPTNDEINAAPFRVTNTGALTATNATITGAITATSGSFTGSITSGSGSIGGFNIGATSLTAGTTTTSVGVTTDAIAFYAGNATPGSAPFKVTNQGALTASSGTVGGWTLDTDAIYTGTKTGTGSYTSTAGHVTIGSDGHISAKEFRIDADGNAFFAGDISAATGTFGSSIAIGTGDSIFKADSNGIYLGDADFADAEFSVTPAGLLKAISGTVGGWTLASTTLTGTNVTLDSTGALSIGSSNSIFKANSTEGIYLGNATLASAPFRVNLSGDLVASSADITGAIKASSGQIGSSATNKWIIGTDSTNASIYNGKTTLADSTNAGVYIGTDGISLGTATVAPQFSVTSAGVLNATSATITGTITATDGRIGSTTDGWDINANVLESKNDYIKLDAANNKILVGNITLQGALAEGDSYIGLGKTGYTLSETAGIYAGLDNGVAKLSIGNTTNSLTWDGVDLSVSGEINATSGTFNNTITVGTNETDKIYIIGASTAQGTKIYAGDGDYNDPDTGFYLDASGRFSLGDQLYYDPGTNTLEILGNIAADTGSIGGWNVGTSTITSSDMSNINAPEIQLQKAGKIVLAGDGFDGNGVMTNPKLTIDGTATGSNAMISSDNFTINYDGSATFGKLNVGTNGSIASTDNSFSISAAGAATFAGALSAATGSFGDTTINGSSTLTIGTYEAGVSGDIKLSNASGIVARDSSNTTVFSVSTSGALVATNADITGTITADDGEIGGWSIDSTSISSGDFILESNANTPYLSIGQGTEGYELEGIFFGKVSNGEPSPTYKSQFSIVGAGGDPNYLKWDGSDLLLKGNLSGEISAINIDRVTIDSAGIRSQILGTDPAVYSFYLNSDNGTGGIGGWDFNGDTLTAGNITLDATSGSEEININDNIVLNGDGSATIGVLNIATDGTISTSAGSFEINGTTGDATFAGEITAESGQIGGFNISDSDLTATNFKLASGSNPYLYFGSDATPAYGDEGIFAGMSSTDSKFSLVSGTTFLKYDTSSSSTYDLEISGNAKVGPLLLNNLTTLSTESFDSSNYTGSGTINITSDAGSITTSRTFTFTNGAINISNFSVTYTTSGTSSGYWTLTALIRNNGNVIAKYTRQSAAGTFTWSTTGVNVVATDIRLELSKAGGTPLTFSVTNLTGVRTLESMKLDDFAVYPNGTVFSNRFQTKDLLLIDNNIETRDTVINLKSSPTAIGGGGVAVLNNDDTAKDGIIIQPSIVYGSSNRRITLATPVANLSANRTIRFPDASGTIALLDNIPSVPISVNAFKTDDENLTTATNVLTVAIPVIGVYRVLMSGAYYSSSTTIGAQVSFTYSGSFTAAETIFNITVSLNSAASSGDFHNAVGMNTAVTSTSVSNTATDMGMSAIGVFRATTTGNFSLRLAPETGTTQIGCSEGTFLSVEKIGD
jgi:hypothetical protein